MTELDKDLVSLAELQNTASAIASIRHAIENMPEKKNFESAKAALDKHRSVLDVMEKEKQEIVKEIKKLEDETRTVDDKAKAEEKKLYGGMITNPKELKAIQQEVESIKRRKDELETAELEVMDKADELENKIAPVSKKVEELARAFDEAKADFETRSEEYEDKLLDLESKFTALKKEIPQESLSKYERLAAEKRGIAVAILKEGICTGCHLSMPAEDMANFLAERKLGKCPNCKRMLLPPEYGDTGEQNA